MRVGVFVLVCFGLSFTSVLMAQDFAVDSVHYTPIPQTYGQQAKVLIESQDKTVKNHKYGYYLSTQVGSLVGCTDCAEGKDITSTVSIINGLTISKKIRAGIGLGFDSFVGWHTLPAYASLSWDIIGNKNRNALFVQVNYGFAKAWNQKSYQAYGYKSADGGRMFAPLLGYRVKYHKLNLSLLAGAKLQRVFSHYEYPAWNWVSGEYKPGTNKSTVKQDMSRLMVSMAIGWQ